MRNKLIELIYDGLYVKKDDFTEGRIEKVADHLLANGVTIQKWISVNERLPEDSGDVLVCHKNGFVTTNAWLGHNWWFKNEKNPITHWMPLPEPPKEET